MPERTGDLWTKVATQEGKKAFYTQGSEYMAKTTEFSEPGIEQTFKTISAIEVRGLVTTEEAETLRSSLANRVRPEIVAGKYVYSTTLIGALYGEQRQGLNAERYFTIKKRVVEAQSTKPFPPTFYVADVEAMADIASEESPHGKIHNDFTATLPTLRLTPSQASTGSVARNFGPEAEKSLAKRRGKIHLQISPEDPLLQTDLSEALGKKLPLAQFVDSSPGAIPVVVKKLRHEERVQPERTETVTVAQHNVNFVAAALLMPRNASYLYDKRTGGITLEYAYEIKAGPSKAELVRGTLNRSYSTCANSRIVNVFGGVSSADFIANDNMRADCSGTPVEVSEVRKEVEALLLEAIAKQPALFDMQ
ncbi:hypothetical protein [Cupriavidus nantongensis]|uniref:Uncharacterized protein n=1 Tax=Cupriavidus nantongensis TaxID=1796606 RepID=A0A142JHT6_9BURK|nr:hypothetical protein [Cupriavidus nantongensis]AMR77648.1 hypothetical protein A2G96_07815 [Cupriavidus nantongensis]